jgi:hypothetical protein
MASNGEHPKLRQSGGRQEGFHDTSRALDALLWIFSDEMLT